MLVKKIFLILFVLKIPSQTYAAPPVAHVAVGAEEEKLGRHLERDADTSRFAHSGKRADDGRLVAQSVQLNSYSGNVKSQHPPEFNGFGTHGEATLIGSKEIGPGQCKYVFLTNAHNFTTMDGRYLNGFAISSLHFHPQTEIRVRLHPAADLKLTGSPTNFKNDIAVFSITEPCIPKDKVSIIPVFDGPIDGMNAFVNRQMKEDDHWLTNMDLWEKDKQEGKFTVFIHETVHGKVAKTSEPAVYEFQRESFGDNPFLPGSSGSGILVKIEGKPHLVGAYSHNWGSDDLLNSDFRMKGFASAGPDIMKWVKQALQDELEERGGALVITTDKITNFPPAAIFHD